MEGEKGRRNGIGGERSGEREEENRMEEKWRGRVKEEEEER